MIAFESECSGHPAASGVGLFNIESDLAQQFQLRLELHDCGVMTMRLHQGLTSQARQLKSVALTIDEFAQRHRCLTQALRVFVRGKEIVKLVAEDGDAAWLESDDRHALIQLRPQLGHHFTKQRLGLPQEAPVVERTSAAEWLAWNRDLITRRFEDIDGRYRGFGMEVIVERVGPEENAAIRLNGASPSKLRHERLSRIARHLALRRDAEQRLRQRHHQICRARRERCQSRPSMDPSHGVRSDGAQSCRVVVRQKLGLVRRHVDVDRAVALASLAGEAQIECVFDRLVAPACRNLLTFEHLEEQTGPASRGVLLLARGHEARAHGATFHAPALSDSNAAQHRAIETAFIFDQGRNSAPSRRFSIGWYGVTTLPGFIFHCGSQIDLNSRNAPTSSSPNIFGNSSARD